VDWLPRDTGIGAGRASVDVRTHHRIACGRHKSRHGVDDHRRAPWGHCSPLRWTPRLPPPVCFPRVRGAAVVASGNNFTLVLRLWISWPSTVVHPRSRASRAVPFSCALLLIVRGALATCEAPHAEG
jgi:hypothetical protein